jgi:acyl-CoA synthetase (NDP forming)
MRALLRPRRLAYVGASDKNLFSRRAFAQQQRFPAGGEVTLVNPRSPEVHGRATVRSCLEVPGGIDFAYLLTPQHATLEALADAAAAGARAAVVLSQGWAEAGPEGAARQRELASEAQRLGVTLLGPNHLGFVNLHDGVAACGLGLDLPVEPGSLGLVSQSGAVGSSMVGYAARQDVRFSFVVTTGNEAMVTIADVLHFLVDDPNTSAIAVFAETIRKPQHFLSAARRAAEVGKPVVILKVGSSELAARTAAAHTGALVGDDRVIDAVLRQHGVIRVRSLEDLITTADLAATVGPLRAPGVAILSVSGGACDLIADRGEAVGLVIPPLSEATATRLGELLPSYAHPQNPLDVTGGALADPEVWRTGITVMAEDERIGLFGVVTSLPTPGEPQRADTFHAVGEALRAAGVPGVVFPQVEQAPSDHVRTVRQSAGIDNVLPSLERFVLSASHLASWSEWRRSHLAQARPPREHSVPAPVSLPEGPLSEHTARRLLEQAGVPVVPAVLAASPDEAADAARALGGAVVLKVCSPDIAHKTEVDGVRLDVRGEDAVRQAFADVTSVSLTSGTAVEGVLVGAMRRGGDELVVGIVRDPDWGLVLAVGLGGEFVELLDDVALRVLPVDEPEVRQMLRSLQGHAVLTGFRGRPPVDLDALVSVIAAIADLAARLPADVTALEVNPLRVSGHVIEALDVLVTREPVDRHGPTQAAAPAGSSSAEHHA